MKPIVIVGIGEFAELAHYYFEHDSTRRVEAFAVDSEYLKSSEFRGLPLVPYDRVHERFPPDAYELFVAIGYTQLNSARARKCADAKLRGYRLASYVSSRASVWPHLVMGDNCFILEGGQIQPFVRIGNHVIICCGSLISHHVEIGDNCFIAAGAAISGGVTVEENCFIGVNATIRDHVTIRHDCIIGANALILADTPPDGGYIVVETSRASVPSRRLRALL
jgi:sugar O-acyltransferase (sialic acid O-acetyltransferase NeuD family)